MNDEVFKPIEEFPDYMISNYGNVKRTQSDFTLKSWYNEKGYVRVSLSKNNKTRSRFIHRLIAYAFIPNPFNYDQINHIDGDKANNKLDNLEWCTYEQNKLHAINTLNSFNFLKSKPIARKLTEEQVINIKQIFKTQTVTTELINSIALEHNVNPQTIRCIHWGKTWKDIN